MKPQPFLAAAAAAAFFPCLVVAAPIPGLFNTGVDEDRDLLPGEGALDPHYQIVASADFDFPGPDAVTLNAGYPVPPWLAEGPDSRWIAPQAASGNVVGGEYCYETTFDLTGFDPDSARIEGEWAVDNEGSDILLNGVSTGNSVAGFAGLVPFLIDSGFTDGVNTLEFVVFNAGEDAANPSGLRVEMRGTVEVPGEPPSIFRQPDSVNVFAGESLMLSVVADGQAPLEYQWQLNGEDIAGADAASYEVAAAAAADGGEYTVVVNNAFGTETSEAAVVSVFQSVPGVFPTGVDDLGVVLDDGAKDPHYTVVENPDLESPDAIVHDGTVFPIVNGPWLANDFASKWISPRFDTISAAGGDYTYRINFDLSGFDPASAFLEGRWASDNAGLDIVINDNPTGLTTTGFTAWSTIDVAPGLFVEGENTIEFRLNNASVGYTGLRVDGLRVGALPFGDDSGPPRIFRQPEDQTIPIGGTAIFSVVANGAQPLAYQWRLDGVDIAGEDSAELVIAVVGNDDVGGYSVAVTNGEGSETSDVADLEILPQPPLIVTQPADTAAARGEDVVLSVVVEGLQPIAYQWRLEGVEIAGANGPELLITSARSSDAGEYDVLLSNADGAAASEPAVLTVLDAVPGVFNTGVDNDALLLLDNEVDPHYTLVNNPNGPGTEALAMGGIPSPPWVPNSASSRWIGPSPDSNGAPGLYTFQTQFDLLGFDIDSVVVSGLFSTDNGGTAVRLNGVETGITHPGNFDTLLPFTIDSGFIEGVNTLEFDVTNAGDAPNPVGLRIEDVRALGNSVGIAPFQIVEVSRGADGRISFTWNSIPRANYAVYFSTDLRVWFELDDAVPSEGTSTSFTDTINDPGGTMRYYRVERFD